MEMVQPILAIALVLGLLAVVTAFAKGLSPFRAPADQDSRINGSRLNGSVPYPFQRTGLSTIGSSSTRFFLSWTSRFFTRTRRFTGGTGLSVSHHIALTPTHRLHIVLVHDREILLVTHPHGCSQLNPNPIPGTPSASEEGRA